MRVGWEKLAVSANKSPYLRNGVKSSQSYCKIRSRIRPFDWCQNQRPWMTLNGRYELYCRKDAYLGAHHKNWNEHRPILSEAKM